MIQRKLRSPGGFTILLVLGVMVVIAVAAVGVLAVLTAQRQVLRREEARWQAEWLATAGLERGAARLLADAAFRAETWDTAGEELSSHSTGSVTITVEPQAQAGRFLISAAVQVARPGGQSVRAVRSTHFERTKRQSSAGEKS